MRMHNRTALAKSSCAKLHFLSSSRFRLALSHAPCARSTARPLLPLCALCVFECGLCVSVCGGAGRVVWMVLLAVQRGCTALRLQCWRHAAAHTSPLCTPPIRCAHGIP